jgi:dihydroxy-acid dehydratase
MTPQAFTNALRVVLAIGGSTNALIHLTAIAGRLGICIDLGGVDAMSRETPVLVDLKPSGKHYAEDLQRAGGLVMVLRELRHLLHLDCLTVSGRSLGEEIDAAPPAWPQEVVRPLNAPLYPEGGIAVLRGNLAPDGAIIKQSSANPGLLSHTGRSVVFDSIEDMMARIDDPNLDVRPEDVLVMRNAGPRGAPGMPEAGNIPIPRKLAQQGVNDMVRISDARMSGTASGTIVLHVCPEAAVGGPLSRVRTGDQIRLDLANRRLDVLVSDVELFSREPVLVNSGQANRGYRRLHLNHVLQADEGCDLEFATLRPYVGKAPL